MGRDIQYTFEVKKQAVLDYIHGKGSVKSIAGSIGAHPKTLRTWIIIYKSQGEVGLPSHIFAWK